MKGLSKIEIIEINRENNWAYVAQYSPFPNDLECTNTSYNLEKMEKDLGITFNKQYYDFLTLFIEQEQRLRW